MFGNDIFFAVAQVIFAGSLHFGLLPCTFVTDKLAIPPKRHQGTHISSQNRRFQTDGSLRFGLQCTLCRPISSISWIKIAMIRRWLALTYYLYALRLAALSHFYFNPL